MAAEMQASVQVLEAAGQAHVVAHAATLPEAERAAFLQAAAAHPWEDLRSALVRGHSASPALRPPQALTLRRQRAQGGLCERLSGLGCGLLAGGRVATLLLAGGQGTRLGYEGPKGCLSFGPEEERTLYRIHAEGVAAMSALAGRPVPLYVLVSPSTRAATEAAFAEREAWGLDEDQVTILEQAQLPALDDEGRALLAAPGRLALAPDGHGGAFHALATTGAIEQLADYGVDVLTTFQVDNPLALPLDPIMLGWMVERRLHAIGKAVRKAEPGEKVGVFARDLGGRQQVVEYTELDTGGDDTHAGGESMSRELDLGSIAIHGFAVSWLRDLARAGFALPLHRARKKVSHLDASGSRQEPDEPNAWKLERFLFDLFPQAGRAEVHEVDRAREFAPVKNATGRDSLVSARLLVDAEVRRRYRDGGLAEPETPALRPREIGP